MTTKYITSLTFLFLVLFGQSCRDDDVTATPVPERLVLELDLEDHVYKFDGQWYDWDEEVVGCEPAFQAEYLYETATLRITFCEVLGTMSPNNYVFVDPNCTLNATEFHDQQENEKTIIDLQVDVAFHDCLYEQSDWIHFEFDFFYK